MQPSERDSRRGTAIVVPTLADFLGLRAGDVDSLLRAGLSCIQVRRHAEGERLLRAALAIEPERPMTYVLLAELYAAQHLWGDVELCAAVGLAICERLELHGRPTPGAHLARNLLAVARAQISAQGGTR
jgi:hypothetical protein